MENNKDSAQYIWRTVQDDKVRSSHAARAGETFSWTNPPEGGHPGEDYNCRCWAEPVATPILKANCNEERRKYEELQKRVKELSKKLNDLLLRLNKLKEEHNMLIGKARKALGSGPIKITMY